jgi:hypothetical protein
MVRIKTGEEQGLPVNVVETLIRPHLAYDEETGSYRKIRTVGRIIGTYGANVDSVVRLARDGRFSGGSQDTNLHGHFFLTPNYQYAQWDRTETGQRMKQLILERKIDSVREAIEYSETRDASDLQHEQLADSVGQGVVLTFNGHALYPGTKLYEDISSGSLELTLPETPGLQAIEGIYPVNEFTADSLHKALAEFH